MKAFILAGGEGTRLRPVTYEIPKPLLPVQKKPIINYLVDMFRSHGVSGIIVSVSRKHENDFKKWKHEFYPDAKIDFAVEDVPLGTFGSLMLVRDRLGDNSFFMTNGDELKKFNLKELHEFHNRENSLATMGLVKVLEPQHYGVAVREGDLIRQFIEKPAEPPSSYVNSGLYMLHPDVMKYYPFSGVRFSMVEKDLFPRLAGEGKLHGVEMDGAWFDCGTFERWERAIKEWKSD